MALAAGYLTDIIRGFRGYKKLGDASIAQVSDAPPRRRIAAMRAGPTIFSPLPMRWAIESSV